MKKIILLTILLLLIGVAGCELQPVTSNTFTVNFDSNGGSSVSSVETDKSTCIEKPEDPEKTGFIFAGWLLDGKPWVFNSHTVKRDITLRANWLFSQTEKPLAYYVNGELIYMIDASKSVQLSITLDGVLYFDWYSESQCINKVYFPVSNSSTVSEVHLKCFTSETYNGIIYRKATDGSYYSVISYNESFLVADIMEEIDGIPVKKIEAWAFFGHPTVEELILPEGIEFIGKKAFSDCYKLKSVSLPETVIEIGESGFSNCFDLEKIELNDNLEVVGDFAFLGCSKISEIVIGSKMRSIGYSSFYNCKSLESIVVSSDNSYFTSSDSVLFDKEMKTLLLYPAAKKDVIYELPEPVETISTYSFCENSSLKQVIISDSVSRIETRAFVYCDNLLTLYIPNSVINVANNVVHGYNEFSFVVDGIPSTWESGWNIDGCFFTHHGYEVK